MLKKSGSNATFKELNGYFVYLQQERDITVARRRDPLANVRIETTG